MERVRQVTYNHVYLLEVLWEFRVERHDGVGSERSASVLLLITFDELSWSSWSELYSRKQFVEPDDDDWRGHPLILVSAEICLLLRLTAGYRLW